MEELLKLINQGVQDGDRESTIKNVNKAVAAGLNADEILKNGLIPAMSEVGRLFEEGEYFVPEMLVAARAMKGGLEILKPLLVEGDVKPIGKVVIGTAKGDLHDIGKNLVAMMMEGAGFEVFDLGTDVPPDEFVEQAKNIGADIVAISALLTTTMTNMAEVVKLITEAGLREQVKILIGGAPITDEFTRKIGADGYAQDASQAAKLAISIIKAK
jgi:5-methyltetrahydrofolate--homocysteine methyltransferase